MRNSPICIPMLYRFSVIPACDIMPLREEESCPELPGSFDQRSMVSSPGMWFAAFRLHRPLSFQVTCMNYRYASSVLEIINSFWTR